MKRRRPHSEATCVRIHLLKGEGVSERECVRYTEKESASFLVGAKDG